jgi:hypothetical protein
VIGGKCMRTIGVGRAISMSSGFLAKAHIGHAVEGETVVAGRVDGRIQVQAGI